MNVTLDGKVAIVTGAAGGIGLATVREFLESGAKGVVGVDVAERPRELEGQERIRWVRGDVSLEKTAEEYARVAVGAFGRIDVMVNNAAAASVKGRCRIGLVQMETASSFSFSIIS